MGLRDNAPRFKIVADYVVRPIEAVEFILRTVLLQNLAGEGFTSEIHAVRRAA